MTGSVQARGGKGFLAVYFASKTVQMSVTSVNQWILHCTPVLYRWLVWPQPKVACCLFSAISAQQVFSWYFPVYNTLKPNGHYMYHKFNINQFYVLPTQYVHVLCVDLRTNSDYFTVQHWLVGFYNRDGVCLLRGTFYILRSAHTVYLCVLGGSQIKQRLFHCTALTDWLVFITETECVYCAVRSTFHVLPTQLYLCVLCGSENKQRLFHCTALTDWFL